MFQSRNLRLASVGLLLLLSSVDRAEATNDFKFTECITNCIAPSSCPPSRKGTLDGKCMCKAARDNFLEDVLRCMNIYCKPDLRDFDDKFLEPMEDGCDELNKAIPKQKLKAAESIGSSLLSSLPTAANPATATITRSVITSPSKTTLRTNMSVTESASSSSAIEEVTSEPSSTPSTASAQAPPPSSTTTAPASTDADFRDTSPFTNNRSTGSQSPAMVTLLALLPLAAIGFSWM
ncbi:hypothetical protein QBC38DRAFT_446300 [Podospora fimiseda]|uniref:Extracellular membrane protein CFEM domain-containing protein n=1 Tax=Podospora fimiseda TaxID=252190 RepID=A0AAN7GTP5_9PEZI|nr:hypothetical protein QBC38DRAFT_446300 [Podospora fimiseda]